MGAAAPTAPTLTRALLVHSKIQLFVCLTIATYILYFLRKIRCKAKPAPEQKILSNRGLVRSSKQWSAGFDTPQKAEGKEILYGI